MYATRRKPYKFIGEQQIEVYGCGEFTVNLKLDMPDLCENSEEKVVTRIIESVRKTFELARIKEAEIKGEAGV